MTLLLVFSVGCHDDGGTASGNAKDGTDTDHDTEVETDDGDDPAGYASLDPALRLVRISTALRGRRPSLEELDRVEADPDALPEIVDGYLDSEGFREVIRDLHNDSLFMEVEIFEFEAVGPLEGITGGAIAESVMQGPLRLIEDVVMSDRPYTDIVTAGYWMVDDVSSEVWGTAYDVDGPTWQRAAYPDDRPAAGILADNGFYMRHDSCGFNFNRGRANEVSTALLCHDFLAADVNVAGSVDLADPEAVANAARTEPSCIGCHQSLDPLATVFNPFLQTFVPDPPYDYPLDSMYEPEAMEEWPIFTGRAPGYYGQPVDDVGELGRAIAEDPRFSLCTATRFYSYLAQVPLEAVPVETASHLQRVLEDSAFDAKALVREIVLSEEFGRGSANDALDAEDLVGYKRARPFQVGNLYSQLTGWEWVIDTAQLEGGDVGDRLSIPRNALIGYEVLAGGHDSFTTTTASRTANVTTVLFMQKMARESASFVVEQDFALPAGERRLLTLVESGDTKPALIRAQLVRVFRQVFGDSLTTDDQAVSDAFAIFDGVLSRGESPETAWKITLAALLQDPALLYY